MFYDDIVKAVEQLKKRFHEDDPFLLARAMGIILLPRSFALGENAMKGFFLQKNRIKTITYNVDLPVALQRIILAHELGHAMLHAKSGVYAFHDLGLFDESSRFEKEANLFAAELLLKDDEVLDSMNADGTFFSAAASLKVPTELLDFKFRVMKWKGFKIVEPPIIAMNDFLRDVEIPKNTDDHVS